MAIINLNTQQASLKKTLMKSSVLASSGPKITASKIKVSDIPEIKFGSVPKAIGSQPKIPQISKLDVPSIPEREESGLGEQPLFQAPKIEGSSGRGRVAPTVSKSISQGSSGQNTTKMIKNLQRSFRSLRSRFNRLQRRTNTNQRIQNRTIKSLQQSSGDIIQNQGDIITNQQQLQQTVHKTVQNETVNVQNKYITELQETTNNIIQSQSEIQSSLQETTHILNDIGNAMSADFADRITKEREAIKKARKKKRDSKREAAEKGVEGSSTIGKAAKNIADKVKKPVMGLMGRIGRIVAFLTLGLIASPAIKWLRNNAKAVDGFFGFFSRHWLSILGFGFGSVIHQTVKGMGAAWNNMGKQNWLRRGLRGARNKLFGPKVTQTGVRTVKGAVTDAAFDIKPKTVAQFARRKGRIGRFLQRSNIVAKRARRLPIGRLGGGLLSVLFAGMEFKGRKDEGQTTGKALIGTAGSTLGGIGGAKAGALAGAAIGSIIPGAGTAIGAVLGGLIGGIGGAMLGGKVADVTSDAIGLGGDTRLNKNVNQTSKLEEDGDTSNVIINDLIRDRSGDIVPVETPLGGSSLPMLSPEDASNPYVAMMAQQLGIF